MKNLLAPIDFSDVTDRVIDTAEQMARAFGAKLWLIHCVKEHPVFAPMEEVPLVLPDTDMAMSERHPEQYQELVTLTSALKAKGIDAEALFVVGIPADEILFVADQYQIDLILMGSHGHGALYEMVMGSVAQAVLHQTNRLTLIVPSEIRKGTTPVVADTWEEPMATPY